MTKTRATTLLLVVLLLTFSVSAQEPPTSGQRLALYSKPAVVRVFGAYIAEFAFRDRSFRVSIGGVGSGFFLNPDGYIATNAHVVGEIQGGEEKARQSLAIEAVKQVGTAYLGDYRRLTSDQARDVLANLQLRSIKKINFVQLTNGDFLPYEIKAFGAPVGQGKDCAVLKIEAKNTPTLQIGDSTKVQLQDRIFAFGYPGAVDTLADFGVLDQKSRLEASITDGTVSALKNTNDGAPVLQVSVPITHGNSGGPALNEKGEVIGLATFGSISSDGQEVQGFNFLVPSSTLMEFVRQAGAQNISGTVDETYREGLELYWDRQYTAAIGKFNDVKLLYPPHSEVEQLISQASKFKAEGKEKSLFFSPILIIAVAAGGLIFLLLIVGVGILIIVKRPKAT
ncbi:MAG: trypsin-like peptidase domain-containing protein, partial [Blastocatellia bacterium]|nr:trypsin-like peptidase domain-containing protein [Blastocatellia bacterium]